MILCIDIGNTNIKAALFDDTDTVKRPAHLWRISSDDRRTADEYYAILSSIISPALPLSSITACAISSVVPALTSVFCTVCTAITGREAVVVSADMNLSIRLPPAAKSEIGSDLLCDANEVYSRCHCPCIVCDAGTALSFVAIGNDGTIEGVAIAPGINTALSALTSGTAQLFSVPLIPPSSSLGHNTTEALQSGVVLGYTHLVKGLLLQMKDDLFSITSLPCRTFATGGLSPAISCLFDEVDKDITLLGILRAYTSSL